MATTKNKPNRTPKRFFILFNLKNSENKILINYSLFFGLVLIATFLINTTWPETDQNAIVTNLIDFGETFLILILYLRESSAFKSYMTILLKSLLMALIASFIASLFFNIYISFINVTYFEDLAIMEKNKLELAGYDENFINRTLKIIGIAKLYHLKEIFLTFSTLIKTLATSLILGPFFLKKVKS